ncbi:DNA/RNA polymerases superfamily protein [Gossypium australe]|uniref:DNA/RNA polymerases superfamily protein n=1 Tax=Gossypium australe TaxID=47621 RepID=A0A5B6VCG7_9ROSI|nr:DNA/RNA polymerases superfamily protein [Gossypium australe]
MSRWVKNEETVDFGLNSEGVLCFRGRVCVLRESKRRIVAHTLCIPVETSYTKIYVNCIGGQDLSVSKCLTCQQVKTEHQLPSRLLQPVKIPLWK